MAELRVFKADDGSLRAGTPQDQDIIDKWKVGKSYRLTYKRIRNPRHHAKFMVFIRALFENQEQYKTEKAIRTALLIAAGHCDIVIGPDGTVGYTPASLAFDSMDQDAFDQVYRDCITVGVERFLPQGWTVEQLDAYVNNLLMQFA